MSGTETKQKHRGVTIYTMKTRAGEPVHRALHGDRYIIAWDEKGLDHAKAVIDQRLLPKEDLDKKKLPGLVRRTYANAPKGCNGLGVLNARLLRQSLILSFAEWITEDLRRELAAALGQKDIPLPLAALTPVFEKYHLDNVVWYTGNDGKKITIRVLW